jgi:hypothetical protein
VNAVAAFVETANAVEETMLLVTPSGEIVAANRAAVAEFGTEILATRRLGDFLAGESWRLADFLHRCSGGKEAIPAVLAFRAAGWDGTREFRVDGALFRPDPDLPLLLRLRMRPKEAATRSFGLLTRQVEELNREIDRRRRYEAELTEALRGQVALLQELQHRVRNTIQLFLGLLNREARQAGGGPPNLRDLAARFQAVGFVQKQVGASHAALNHIDIAQLASDLVAFRHPDTGGENAFGVDVEPIVVPVEVATPLALLLNECLAATLPRRPGLIAGGADGAGRLRLALSQDGAAEAFAAAARKPLAGMLAAQLQGSVASDISQGKPTLVIGFPHPMSLAPFSAAEPTVSRR